MYWLLTLCTAIQLIGYRPGFRRCYHLCLGHAGSQKLWPSLDAVRSRRRKRRIEKTGTLVGSGARGVCARAAGPAYIESSAAAAGAAACCAIGRRPLKNHADCADAELKSAMRNAQKYCIYRQQESSVSGVLWLDKFKVHYRTGNFLGLVTFIHKLPARFNDVSDH